MPKPRRRPFPRWLAVVGAAAFSAAIGGCSDDDADRLTDGGGRFDVPGPSEATTPAPSVPTPPPGGAMATVRWRDGRAENTAQLTDQPSVCRVEEGAVGWSLMVEIGSDQPGTDRASDALRLRVGPLGRLDGPGVDPGGPLLAEIERLDLVVAGGGLPSSAKATDVLASVKADLSSLHLPLADGSLEVTCGR